MSRISLPNLADVLASVVVLLVAVPLCLGIAVAVGLPSSLGLISGVVGGIVVSALGGARLQVSGPAAGLVTIVWEVIQTHGVEHLGIIVLFAGLLQVAFSALHIGLWFRAVSPAIVHAMLGGIGLLIMASQFHVMLDRVPKSTWLENITAIPLAISPGPMPIVSLWEYPAAQIGVLTISMIILWKLLQPFLPAKCRFIPAQLVAVLLAVLVAAVFEMPVKFVSVPENLLAACRLPEWQDWSYVFQSSALLSVATIAIVASMESLLTAVSLEKLSHGERANCDRELFGQGVGNILAGLVGAIPITGVIARSAANVQAGACSRWSGVLHGVWLLLFLLLCPALLKWIPVSALAAILLYTGYTLVNTPHLRDLWQAGRSEFAIYLLTMGAIVMTSLLEGILFGLVLTATKFFITQSNLKVLVTQTPESDGVLVQLEGNANFVCLPRLTDALEHLPSKKAVLVCLNKVTYIDHACLDCLLTWEEQYEASGGSVHMQGHALLSVKSAASHA